MEDENLCLNPYAWDKGEDNDDETWNRNLVRKSNYIALPSLKKNCSSFFVSSYSITYVFNTSIETSIRDGIDRNYYLGSYYPVHLQKDILQ